MDLDQQVLFGLMRGLVAIILPPRYISALFEPMTLWHVYLKAYINIGSQVSTRSLLTLYNGYALETLTEKNCAGKIDS